MFTHCAPRNRVYLVKPTTMAAGRNAKRSSKNMYGFRKKIICCHDINKDTNTSIEIGPKNIRSNYKYEAENQENEETPALSDDDLTFCLWPEDYCDTYDFFMDPKLKLSGTEDIEE